MLASDWPAQTINISESNIKLSCQPTQYLTKPAKLLMANKPGFPQDQDGKKLGL